MVYSLSSSSSSSVSSNSLWVDAPEQSDNDIPPSNEDVSLASTQAEASQKQMVDAPSQQALPADVPNVPVPWVRPA